MKVQTGPWGTKEKPQVVPSMFEERIVGCICEFGHYIGLCTLCGQPLSVCSASLCLCVLLDTVVLLPYSSGDEDSTSITWMVLKKGPPGRCECGHWYQLAHGNPIKVH